MVSDKSFKFQKRIKMNNSFLRRQAIFVMVVLFLSFLLFAIHWYVIYHFFESVELTLPLWSIYIFHFITVLIVYTLSNYKASKDKSQVFAFFMGATLVKMILAIVFLLPVLLQKVPNATADVLNFFIPYFLFLVFEILSILRFLKSE